MENINYFLKRNRRILIIENQLSNITTSSYQITSKTCFLYYIPSNQLFHRTVILLFLLAIFFLHSQTIAQWVQTNGPYEASISSFASEGSYIFAGTIGAGIYRSSDNGLTWTPSNGNMTNTFTSCIAVSGRNIFAGSATGEGVSLSTDDGASWTQVNNGLPYGAIHVLAVSGNNIYAGVVYSGGATIFLSTNKGTNWLDISSPIKFNNISAIVLIPKITGGIIVYVGSTIGIYRSEDNGTSWASINTGLTDTIITALAVSGTNLYAGTNNGVFLSTDKGSTWSLVDSGPTGSEVSCFTVKDTIVFAGTLDRGVFISTDNGTSWSEINNGLNKISVNALASIGSNIFAGFVDAGIYRSHDNGTNWTAVNTGLKEVVVNNLSLFGKTVFAGTSWNLYFSTDQGSNWIPTELYGKGCNSLIVMDNILFAGGDGISEIYFSSDGGTSWKASLNLGLPEIYVTCLATNGNDLIAGTKGVAPLGNFTQGGVFISTDRGNSWKLAGLKNIVITALANDGSIIYAGTDQGAVEVSTDNGLSWTDILNVPFYITDIATRDNDLFIGVWGGGVLYSTVNKYQWKYMNAGLADTALYVSTINVHDKNVFIGTKVGVYALSNNDTSWLPANDGLSVKSSYIYALVADDSNLYAGLQGGIWRRPLSEMVDSIPINPLTTFILYQNYPNPFNPSTVISYSLPERSFATLKIYDVLGREIRTLVNENQSAGTHFVTFNSEELSSGVYFYQLTAGNFVGTKKLVLIK
ncbi:MAG TPA: T9SS type A sorting domain-containing protein [Ignavibacteriaceae bacterium]|nr:T9SS type A sorting domain-containing protein [Ignavibacteriaceae bacterium]